MSAELSDSAAAYRPASHGGVKERAVGSAGWRGWWILPALAASVLSLAMTSLVLETPSRADGVQITSGGVRQVAAAAGVAAPQGPPEDVRILKPAPAPVARSRAATDSSGGAAGRVVPRRAARPAPTRPRPRPPRRAPAPPPAPPPPPPPAPRPGNGNGNGNGPTSANGNGVASPSGTASGVPGNGNGNGAVNGNGSSNGKGS